MDWNDILTGHYTNNEENVLTAIEPDLLGEYFVLMRLGELIKIGNKRKSGVRLIGTVYLTVKNSLTDVVQILVTRLI